MSTRKRKSLLMSVAELRALKAEPSQWIVDGLLRIGRRRISLLAGKPESGKSTLGMQLAVAVTKGKPFLGRQTLRSGVIYWQSEEDKEDVRESLERLGYDHTRDEKLLTFFGSAAQNDVNSLHEELLEHSDVRLVVIETLDDLLKLSDIKENSAARAAFDKFDAAVVNDFSAKTAFLALHHLKKRETDSVGDMLLGATTIRGRTDAKMYLRRASDEDPRRIFQATVRKGREILPTFLEFDAETAISVLGHSLSEERKKNVQRTEERTVSEIADFFKNNPDASFKNGCLSVITGNTNDKWRVFKKMLAQGFLVQSGKGTKNSPHTYRLADVATETEAA